MRSSVSPARQIVEDHGNHDPCSLDARLGVTDVRVNADSIFPAHFTSPFSRSCLPMDDHSYLPSSSFFPVFLGFLPRNEFVQRSNVEDHTVVEVGSEV